MNNSEHVLPGTDEIADHNSSKTNRVLVVRPVMSSHFSLIELQLRKWRLSENNYSSLHNRIHPTSDLHTVRHLHI